jgi:hypothetical protein
VVLRYIPPTRSESTEPEPGFNVTPNLTGPSMCVVRGLIFNPTLISINLCVRSARFYLPIVEVEFPIRPAHLLVHVVPKCER